MPDSLRSINGFPASRVRHERVVAHALEPRRLLAGGTLDLTYGTNGIARTAPTGDVFEYPLEVLRQSDGKSLIAGISNSPSPSSDALLTRRNANGTPDASFGTNGVQIIDLPESFSISQLRQLGTGGYDGFGYVGGTPHFVRLTSAGALDASFGTGGLIPVVGWDANSTAPAVIDSSGRAVSGFPGRNPSNQTTVGLQRFTANGALDATFGTGGTMVDPALSYIRPDFVRVLSTGRIIVVGRSTLGASYDYTVLAYTNSGARDTTFGTGGQTQVNFPSHSVTAKSIQVLSSGAVQIVGVVQSGFGSNASHLAIARFTTAGTLDTAYGSATGMAVADVTLSGVAPTLETFALDGVGRVIAAGAYQPSTIIQPFVTRLTAAGALDTSFDGDGKLLVPFSSSLSAHTVVRLGFESDNRPIIAGLGWAPANGQYAADITIQRLTTAGAVDSTFNAGAAVLVAQQRKMAFRPMQSVFGTDGSTYVAGTTLSKTDVAVAKFTSTGVPDAAFGVDGARIFNFGPNTDGYAIAATPRPGGGALIAAYRYDNSPSSVSRRTAILAVRADGTLDPNFGTAGILYLDTGAAGTPNYLLYDLDTTSDGRIIALVIDDNDTTDVVQVRGLTSNGIADPTFASNGPTPGRITIANIGGASWARRIAVSPGTSVFSVVGLTTDGRIASNRFMPNGQFDASWGSPSSPGIGYGPVVASGDTFLDAAYDHLGRLVVLNSRGSAPNASTRLIRFTGGGLLDTSFAATGTTTITAPGSDKPTGLAVEPGTGRIVIVGKRDLDTSTATATASTWVKRVLIDGTVDAAFGASGVAIADATNDPGNDSDGQNAQVGFAPNRGIVVTAGIGVSYYPTLMAARFRPDAASAPVVLANAFSRSAPGQSISITFDQDVSASLAPADLQLQNITTGQSVPAAAMAIGFDAGTNRARVTFPGLSGGRLVDGNYQLNIAASSVTSAAPYSLPMSASASLTFRSLSADANDDGRANFDDLLILAANYNQSGRTYATGDFNYDGACNFDDLLILAASYNVSLLTGPQAIGGPVGIGGDDDTDGASAGNAADVLA